MQVVYCDERAYIDYVIVSVTLAVVRAKKAMLSRDGGAGLQRGDIMDDPFDDVERSKAKRELLPATQVGRYTFT
jgi:hypothetical protein